MKSTPPCFRWLMPARTACMRLPASRPMEMKCGPAAGRWRRIDISLTMTLMSSRPSSAITRKTSRPPGWLESSNSGPLAGICPAPLAVNPLTNSGARLRSAWEMPISATSRSKGATRSTKRRSAGRISGVSARRSGWPSSSPSTQKNSDWTAACRRCGST